MRKLLLPAAAAAALLAIAPMTAASAASHDVLTISKAGGPNVKVGAILQAGLKFGTTAVFATGGEKVTCKRVMFKDQVTKNPSKPGTAVEKLKSQTFSHCSVTGISGTREPRAFKLNHLPYTTTVKDPRDNGDGEQDEYDDQYRDDTWRQDSLYVHRENHQRELPRTNHKRSPSSGRAFTKTSGPPRTCKTTAKFSATFGPVVDTSVTGQPARLRELTGHGALAWRFAITRF